MQKRVLFLSFYFEPDLCAGSFRNSPLAYELGLQAKQKDIHIDIITTLPNRYSSYTKEAANKEVKDNVSINRIRIPKHQSGIKDQINSFKTYYTAVKKIVKQEKYDLVYASSSRLFTAFLGYRIAKSKSIPLYLDIRDIFVDTIKDVFSNSFIKAGVLPFMKYIEKKTFGYASHINLISEGFKGYFKKYAGTNYSYYSNGIDPEFLHIPKFIPQHNSSSVKTILYAGNIGEGQGLHRVIPVAAKKLGQNYKFKVIGDGGAKEKLLNALDTLSNVEILPPVNRTELIDEYNKADFLFIHLNDYDAFKKVLPSKVFELGVFPKPLIAGVNGYARQFIEENLQGTILITPCDGEQLAEKIKGLKSYETIDRSEFIESYTREKINKDMAESILNYL